MVNHRWRKQPEFTFSSIFSSYAMQISLHLLSKYLLSISYSAGTVLGSRVESVNKIGIVSVIKDLTFKWSQSMNN